MDTRTRSASPATHVEAKLATPPPVQDKISAYYSLVFPHYTFYIQTLSITIGRRCAPNANVATSSTAEPTNVDVDLGALKSVSRLHAKIEYDQEDDRFVLAVIGRNGAWVDGVWSGAGTRAPLGERSQIQIASRTFHFVLPPPPPPDDTPSPSSQSSANRPRSPSLDITSISPPSSQPSHSSPPPPTETKPLSPSPEPQILPPPPPQLPNSNAIGKPKTSAKKRKKGEVDPAPVVEKPKPEDMPPKPPFTYAQLINRAIKAIGGKATLQEICGWIMNTHEYYRYADGAWMSSVRHNLSSGRAFLKGERCGGDRGKGFFWSVDEKYAQALEEQETKSQQTALANASGGKEGPAKGSRKKEKTALLEPPLKRSVKGDLKGAPLPPPLTSAPLSFKSTLSLTASSSAPSIATAAVGAIATSSPATTGVFAYPAHPHPANFGTASQVPSALPSGYSAVQLTTPNPYAALTQHHWALHPSAPKSTTTTIITPSTSTPTSFVPPGPSNYHLPPQSGTPSTGPLQPLPGHAPVPDVVIPIILGPIPPTHTDYAPNHPNNSKKEGYMVLHERKLILDPDVFVGLTKEMLEEIEKMGAREALRVLTGHMIKALKERRAKGRGKERGGRRLRGAGGRGGSRKASVLIGPFTNVPLDNRRSANSTTPADDGDSAGVLSAKVPAVSIMPESVPSLAGQDSLLADPGTPIVIIDDSDDEGPATKRRKVESEYIGTC